MNIIQWLTTLLHTVVKDFPFTMETVSALHLVQVKRKSVTRAVGIITNPKAGITVIDVAQTYTTHFWSQPIQFLYKGEEIQHSDYYGQDVIYFLPVSKYKGTRLEWLTFVYSAYKINDDCGYRQTWYRLHKEA